MKSVDTTDKDFVKSVKHITINGRSCTEVE